MTKKSIFALSAMALLLGACADDNVVEQTNQIDKYNFVEGENSWLAIGIAMPGDGATTRANEDLTDGEASEYEVKSGTLVLFKGASEATATLVKKYDITDELGFDNETGDNVPEGNTLGNNPNGFGEITTTSKKIVKEIENPSLGAGDFLYAYVILNDQGNATGIEYTEGQTFADFKVQVLKAIGIADEEKGYGDIGEKGLVMTSVPIAFTPGGNKASNGPVTTLATVNSEAIYPTAAAAADGTSVACIYVERAAVKVEVKCSAEKVTVGSNELNFTFDGWALGNVNNNGDESGYYNTRQFDENWLDYINEQNPTLATKYRMVGRTNFFDAGHTTAYRTYFGRDVNYDSNEGLINAQLTDDQYSLAKGAVTYTYENTFDENSQIFANTTYVGIKATISGGTFYTIEGQPNTKLNNATDIATALKPIINTEILQAIAALKDAISEDLNKTAEEGRTISEDVTKVTFDIAPVVTLGDRDDETGEISYTYKLTLSNLKDQGGNELEEADVNAVNTLAGFDDVEGEKKVYEYTDGVVYYATRIAHFGDAETPWSAPAAAYNNYEMIYPITGQSAHETSINYGVSRAAAWLGRWGIVRNNWYELEITKINGLGSPVPVDYSGDGEGEPGGTPDDNPDPSYFISAHIHILPWVKRFQKAEL